MILKRISAARVSAIATAIRSILVRLCVECGVAIRSSILQLDWVWKDACGQNKTHAGCEHCCVGS